MLPVGFLDKAKKLAEQANEAAEQAKRLASEGVADARNRMGQQGGAGTAATYGGAPPPPPPNYGGSPPPPPPPGAGDWSAGPAATTPAQSGTPYRPGMLGRPGWRERGLTDPAGLLTIKERDQAGVPHSVKSQILEEPFGMGRRWSSGERSAALYYQLYPEHRSWEPPGGRASYPATLGASSATLPDGRSLVFLSGHGQSVVLEVAGIEEPDRGTLARAVADRLAAG